MTRIIPTGGDMRRDALQSILYKYIWKSLQDLTSVVMPRSSSGCLSYTALHNIIYLPHIRDIPTGSMAERTGITPQFV